MKNNKKRIIILTVLLIITIMSSTYAWITWRSSNNNSVNITVGSLTDITFLNGKQINTSSLSPVLGYTGQSIDIVPQINMKAINKKNYSRYVKFYLNITSIDSNLKNNLLKFALLKSSDNTTFTEIASGDFSSATVSDNLIVSNNVEVPAGTTYYRFVVYLDGSQENASNVQNTGINAALNVELTNLTMADKIMRLALGDKILPKLSGNEPGYIENGDFLITHMPATGQTTDLYEYRYKGADPANYVYFNCTSVDTNSHEYGSDNYEYNTTNCELWRIIGVFTVEDESGNTKELVKIIRNDSIGSYSIDNKWNTDVSKTYGYNDWTTAHLMKTLNPGYDNYNYNEDDSYESNSLYWNRENGTCLSGYNYVGDDNSANYTELNKTKSCDFTSSGLKDNAKSRIQEVKWYIGGTDTWSYATDFYSGERRTSGGLANTAAYFWHGKVGLIKVSDYMLASGAACGLDSTTKKLGYEASDNDIRTCNSSNWLYNGGWQWTMSPVSGDSNNFGVVNAAGCVSNFYSMHEYSIRPTVYLKSSEVIKSGSGTLLSPYIIN